MSLEELIPLDVRRRYNITTHTAIDWKMPRSEETAHEIAPINEITLPYNYTAYKDFIEKRKIRVEKVTKESLSACHKAVKAWCVANGYRLVRQDDIQHIQPSAAVAAPTVAIDDAADREAIPQTIIA